MSFYLLRTGYTAAAAKAMVEHPQDREDAARADRDRNLSALRRRIAELEALLAAAAPAA
jgi:hypothetical protein